MTTGGAHPATLARLRANAERAGIALSDEEIDRIVAGPFLTNVDAFETLIAFGAPDTVPDTAKSWAARPAATASPAPTPAAGTAQSDDPLDPWAPLHVMASALAARQISPVELTDRHLARIAAHDRSLNVFQLVMADEARAAARAAEAAIAAGQYRGPFHGIPVAIKDLLAMRGYPTAAGSTILADWVAESDSWAVERLQQAGAIIVGRTRMSEFAYSPASTNAHYGPTRNPWKLEHDTGGSSSGSAAAVAAGLAAMALGSDTGCSIRTPSALCGLVGLKPTHGRISLSGAVTLSWSFDHLGPMTRSVRDAALTLSLLAGEDTRDSRTRPGPVPDFTAGLENLDAVRGRRIGAIRQDGSPLGAIEPAAAAAWQTGLEALQAAGATIVDLDLPELEQLRICGAPIINLEAVTFHEPWLRDRRHEYGEFPRHRLLVAYAYGPLTYIQAQQARARLRATCDQLWQRVDFLSTPALAYGAPLLGDARSNTRFMVPFNSLGWPAIVVPTGRTDDGLPLATQLIGRPWDEVGLLQVARAIECAGLWDNQHPAGFDE